MTSTLDYQILILECFNMQNLTLQEYRVESDEIKSLFYSQ